MAIVTGDQYLESLVKFVENQAERLIEGTLILKLNPVGLRYVQSRLEALAELESLIAGAPVDYLRAYVSDLGDHRALEQLRRILRLLPSLKVVSVLPLPGRDPTPLYLLPFGRLKVLELRGCDLSTSAAKGLLELRFTLEKLICHNSTDALRHVFASRITEIKKDSPQWNRLSFVSCACNGLVLMDESLQLLPVVETLDLSRNKFTKVDNLRKCTKLKHLDLGFNNLRSITSLCEVTCQIVKLDLRNNALSTLHGLESLKSLVGLDLSYNIISNFSEMEILAGLPSLQNLWLEGNPLCCARWSRAQIFSLFSHPEKLKLDEKRISPSEFWKRQIIVASRLQHPSSFGFYVPAKDDADFGAISTKRKFISRVVSIENEEQSTHTCSDQDSVSCDNEIQSKDENAITDNQTEIEHLMKRIEFMKKEHSVLWLQEFKEWMDQTSGNVVDGSKLRNIILSNNKDIHNDGEIKDEDLGETSRYVSDSFQHSGDESSTMILESETSFADTSTVVSAQRFFDRINDTPSKFCMGHIGGDRSVTSNLSMNQEEPRFLNEVRVSADAGDSSFNLLAVTRSDDMSTKKLISSSIAINNIIGSRSSSACPGSPPHYQEDILHRRQNLEEEFLQLSAESFSVASSDSNTSCSEGDSAEVAPKITQVYQSFVHSISGSSENDCFMSSDQGNDYGKNPALKQNGTPVSSPVTKGNFISTEGIELEVCSGSMTDAMHNNDNVDSLKAETDWLVKAKHRRKPRRRLISLPEDDGTLDDTDSSKKSSDYIEICRSDMENEGNECCMSDLSKTIAVRSNGASSTSSVLKCNRGLCSGFNTLTSGTDDFIETYFNSNLANSGINEISMQHMQCNCLFPGKSGYYERDVAVIRSSKQQLYILLIVNECDGSETGLEIVGCHRIGGVREVFVGLGLQVVRVHFEGNATYVFITRCMERSRELLGVLDFLDSSGKKEHCSLTSLEQVQINLFEENICGGSKINIFQYSMVLFWQNNLKEDLWLSRSLFILGGHLILCIEDLLQFGPTENAFFPRYFSLDLYCAIADVSEMVIDTMDNLCVTLALECTSNIHPSEEGYRIKEAILNEKPASHPSTWKLKWFSKESLFNFVALLKAIHGQTALSPVIARYKS